jgi:RHS repeat-associated protein
VSHEADGRGNVLAGGERGGKSHITYRPYGEILRTDSFGPDISKYKYTGQEEDRESGLYFYDSRYYDSRIGRFISYDTEVDALEPNGMNRMMYVNGDPVSFRDPSGNVCDKNIFGAIALFLGGPFLAAGVGVMGNYTGGGGRCYKGMPQEEQAILSLLLPYISKIGDENQKSLAILFSLIYTRSLSGSGPSPIGKLNRQELTLLLLSENEKNNSPLIYSLIYYGMTHNVGNARSQVDRASFFHDQYGANVLRPKNRKANSKWMGQAKTAAFSHDTWSRNYKREWEATGKSCRDARDICATVNTIGTTIGDAAMAATGMILFSIANTVTGIQRGVNKNRYNNSNRPRKWKF